MKPTSAKSKFGKVDLIYVDDSEKHKGTSNPGWVVDKVLAYINGKQVGYIKLSYIPQRNMIKFYPNVVAYKAFLGGWTLAESAIKERDKKLLIKALSAYIDPPDRQLRNWDPRLEIDKMPDKFWNDQYKRLTAITQKQFGPEYEEFKKRWQDQPMVDFIRVDQRFQGGGIGYILYIAGAKWMATKGYSLRASENQTSAAQIIWDKMAEKGLPVKVVGDQKYLDYRE